MQAPAHGFKHTQRALEQAFDMKLSELFESIDRRPVASGSIGQIHKAKLSEKGAAITGCRPGQVVAVKVGARGGGDSEGGGAGGREGVGTTRLIGEEGGREMGTAKEG